MSGGLNLLLTALKHMHINHLRGEKALKRGGRKVLVSFDSKEAEQSYTDLLVTSDDPEKIYLAAWGRSLVYQAREKLRAIYQRAPRPEVAMALEAHLDPDDDRVPYREFAQKFQMKEAVLRLHLYRLRKKFGELLREEVLQTLDVPEELLWLRGVLLEHRTSP
jgi:DNA-directed RNA polymerase specialized sigma24 family protein